jgi:hypothetical protein
MKTQSLITIGLLAFVGVSVVVALRGDRNTGAASGPNDVNAVSSDDLVQIESGVVVYYFHRSVRCVTCNTIEAYTRQVMDSAFAEAQAEGSMQLVSINYETAANEHFVKDFELTSNSVVLVRLEAGQVTQWKNLDQIWEQVQNAPAFHAYIQTETTAFLAGAS